jgi:hypothetical protein
VRIDKASAELAVRTARSIAAIATLPTTLGLTTELVRGKALERRESVELCGIVVTGAHDALVAANRGEHDRLVDAAATIALRASELVLLARASMATSLSIMSADLRRRGITSPP